jgi:hypothetical protein
MIKSCGIFVQRACLLLALLLPTAQTLAVAHAYEHDFESPHSRTCTSCVTAMQLLAACVDTPVNVEFHAAGTAVATHATPEPALQLPIHPRPRGPPTP